jgi:hypothetical protein
LPWLKPRLDQIEEIDSHRMIEVVAAPADGTAA